MFARMQGAYEKEAKVLVSLKMQTMSRCKKSTCEYELANYPLCYNYAQRHQWKFAQIRGYLYAGSMFAPVQGAYGKEAKVLMNLKMQTMARCKKGHLRGRASKLHPLLKLPTAPLWKFVQIRSYLYTGRMFAPMQGAYEKEAKVLVSMKM